MRKILFCSHNPLDLRLGAPKVIMEVASSLEKIGWDCRLASSDEILPGIQAIPQGAERILLFSAALREFVKKNAASYDVVDYDHVYLPYPRRDFAPKPLLVARSVLLAQHFERIPIPRFAGFRSWLGGVKYGRARRAEMRLTISQADLTMTEADLINVSNDHDRAELLRRGMPESKILVVPFGLTRERLQELSRFSTATPPAPPKIAFVGTFDPRKGAREFPDLVQAIARKISGVRFKLMGARYRNTDEILKYFPSMLHEYLEVVPQFEPAELPNQLSDCSLGIFPSYIEGFGFGVLEMLAAGLPVIAYDAPGPPMMLKPRLLVSRGDWVAMSRQVIALLDNPETLLAERIWAKQRAQDFLWEKFALQTSEAYESCLNNRSIPEYS